MTDSDSDTKVSNLLEVKGLKKYFPIRKGFFRTLVGQCRAVDGISFFIRQGETLAMRVASQPIGQ